MRPFLGGSHYPDPFNDTLLCIYLVMVFFYVELEIYERDKNIVEVLMLRWF